MKKDKEPSVKKSVRIPTDVVKELEQEAKEKFNGNFSDTVVYRVKHFESTLTPAVMRTVQDLTNKAVEAVKGTDPKMAEEMQKEADLLWKSLR